MALSAFILIEVAGDHTKSAFKTIQRISGVKASYTVSGSYDLVVQIETENLQTLDRKSTRLNSSHDQISYAVFCLKKKKRDECRRDDAVESFQILPLQDIHHHAHESVDG